MKIVTSAAIVLCTALLTLTLRAEDAKPDAPKTDPLAAALKPDNGDLPKAPDGKSPLNELHQNESLVGEIHKGAAGGKEKKKKKDKTPEASSIVLTVDAADKEKGKKVKGEPKTPHEVTLVATGDIQTQLNTLAEKHAHVKVTGALSGDTLTVKEVSEVPGEAKKKKNKNNA